MSVQSSPRGTYLKVAEAMKARIEADPDMSELPSAADLMRNVPAEYARTPSGYGTALVEPVPGTKRIKRRRSHNEEDIPESMQ